MKITSRAIKAKIYRIKRHYASFAELSRYCADGTEYDMRIRIDDRFFDIYLNRHEATELRENLGKFLDNTADIIKPKK